MKKTIVLFLALSMIALAGYGCEDGGVCTENGPAVNRAAKTKLYYPCNIDNLDSVGATTMSAGYIQGLTDVAWLSRRLADEGYVVLAFTPRNRLGLTEQWREAHKDAIKKLKELNASHRVLRGKIDESKLQTCGHSKGGGGSLWASAELGNQLRTTVAMAPYNGLAGTEGPANISSRFANGIPDITAATLIQAGGADTLATNSMTRAEYAALGAISKMYVEYTGYDHIAWTSTAYFDRQKKIGDHIVAWMKYYMDEDNSYASALANSSGAVQYDWVK